MRNNYFNEVDEDGSGAIDFEEFIWLVYRLRYMSDNKEIAVISALNCLIMKHSVVSDRQYALACFVNNLLDVIDLEKK